VVGVSGDVIANFELLFILYNILGRKLYAFRDGYSTDIDRLSWDWISGCRRRGSRDQGDRRRCHGERTDSKGLRHNDTGWGTTLTARADTIPNLASERFDSDTEQSAEALATPSA
jgi:oxygen-dependent protoporphyrinogen oxidase